jgi:hypothetical protein
VCAPSDQPPPKLSAPDPKDQEIERLRREVERLRRENGRLKQELGTSRGDSTGRAVLERRAYAEPEETLDVPLPARCPDCGGTLTETRIAVTTARSRRQRMSTGAQVRWRIMRMTNDGQIGNVSS